MKKSIVRICQIAIGNPTRKLELLLIGVFFSASAMAGERVGVVKSGVNWEQFMAQQDLIWNDLPKNWESGAFIGNGLLGAMIYSGGTNLLQWDVGRSDVTDRGDRIVIGRFDLQPPGDIDRGEMRLDLWNAEAKGVFHTSAGETTWRSFTHASDLFTVIELNEPIDARPAKIIFQHEAADPTLAAYRHEPTPPSERNPDADFGETNGVNWCLQQFKAGGGYVVAWSEKTIQPGHRLFFFTVDSATSGKPKTDRAVEEIQSDLNTNFDELTASHREWWHSYFPESFLSLPDARLENFWWIQMYKLASATRDDRPPIDLMGPWFRSTPWPRIWWNLNIELTYWPVYAANRLELGKSLINLIDDDFTNFVSNVPEPWRYDSAGVGRSSPYDGKSPVPGLTGGGVMERGNLTWALHNYWLQYRYSGDEKLLLGPAMDGEGGLYSKLKRAVAYYLHLLTLGADGKLHLPLSTSPEYPNPRGGGNALVHDANYDLSLLRWGLNTLLACNERFNFKDPLAKKWSDTLNNLTPNPVDSNGYMVGSDQAFAVSHRHFSHLFSIYPLHLVDPQSASDRSLIEKSFDHWQSMPKAWLGYSYTGASAMSSWLGRKDDAVAFLQEFLDKPKTVLPNTMYTESGPVIETPLSAAASINQIVLQSWSMAPFGTDIRIFPAVPDQWKDVAFENMRTEGAFLVSAARQNGKTLFVQIKSLAGSPCCVSTSLTEKIVASGNRRFHLKNEKDQAGFDLTVVDLKKGETVLLTSSDEKLSTVDLTIGPVPQQTSIHNFYGSPKSVRH